MLKKLLNIGMVACALMLSSNAFAQDNSKQYAPEYPQYGFWSNWSIGAEVGYARQAGGGWEWMHGSNAGWQVIIQKELNYVWNFRIKGGVPGQWKHPENACTSNKYDRFGTTTFGFTFSINDACKGYDPERKNSIYLLADGGGAWKYDETGVLGLIADLGLGWSHKCCEHGTFFIEGTLSDIADVPNIFENRHNLDVFVGLGWMYDFGPTAADKELIAQRAKLNQENFDALYDQINKLNKEVADGKQAEQRLQNTINDLEEQLAKRPLAGNNGNSDSLQNVINQIKDDQLTFYALPFSILYGVDEWKVPEDQNDKVAAIARVMKDNDAVKFNLVGFCDHTGSDAYNMKLSQKRAEELKRVLVKKYGIDEDRLTCDWKGKGMAFGDLKYSVNRRTSVYRVIE